MLQFVVQNWNGIMYSQRQEARMEILLPTQGSELTGQNCLLPCSLEAVCVACMTPYSLKSLLEYIEVLMALDF